ncbi:MAG: hypothetical protein J6T10_19595 [Methanobrevibacter sp.]|nr:hypothetical protein [Methanobrevibacter sp.]
MNKKKTNKLTSAEAIYYFKEMLNSATKLNEAEEVLNKVLDLINSSEILATFPSEKRIIRKPIENYFKKQR